MDGTEGKVNDFDSHLADINSTIDRFLQKSDSLTRSVQDLNDRLANVEEKRTVSDRKFRTHPLHQHNYQNNDNDCGLDPEARCKNP